MFGLVQARFWQYIQTSVVLLISNCTHNHIFFELMFLKYNYSFIKVLRSDLRDVRMIVFRETGVVDVSGNILTDSQFLSSVKVIWHRRNFLVEFYTLFLFMDGSSKKFKHH